MAGLYFLVIHAGANLLQKFGKFAAIIQNF